MPTPAPDPDAPTGAVDAVTRGVDAVLGREVAMVTLPPASGDDLAARTEQVRRLAGLHHAHLLEVFDVDGLAEGHESTLVLQSVAGRGFDPAVDRSRWSSVAVAEIGAQTASALAHAHAHGVVHGGIGPASVVVDAAGSVPFAWLTGFTAALHAPPSTPTGGTPDGDVAALGRVLALVLDPDALAATTVEQTLTAMVTGQVGASTAAESLARIAEVLRRADADETGLVPLVPLDPPVQPPPAHQPSVPSVPERRAGRRARLAGRGLQVAALGGATLTLVTASGLVLWASEGSSAVAPPRTGLPTPSPPPPSAVVAPSPPPFAARDADDRPTRRTTRTPITDVTTTTTVTPPPTVAPPAAPTAEPDDPPSSRPRPTSRTTPDEEPTSSTPRTSTRAPGGNATLAAP